MQDYLIHQAVVSQATGHRRPAFAHSHEVRHRNQWGAMVTTCHFSEAEAGVEKRWRCAHGYTAVIRDVSQESQEDEDGR